MTRRVFVAAGAAGSGMLAAQSTRSSDSTAPASPPRRRLFASRVSLEKVRTSLVPREAWKPYPAASDRRAWESLAPEIRTRVIGAGEKALAGAWPIPNATLLLEFARNGNRSNYERELGGRRNRLRDLVVAECAEGKGRFLDEIVNGVWSISEETWWGYPAHLDAQRAGRGLPDVTEPVIDLFAA